MSERYTSSELEQFAVALLLKSGLRDDQARVVTEILLEGDLLGHTTHGLQLLVPYLKSIEKGGMTLQGEPDVILDRGSTITIDGNFMPGAWLTVKAIETAESRIPDFGVVTVSIRRAHHIGCLQAYLKRVTDQGHVILLACSDPASANVAPHGGLKPLYSPNPLACGIPTNGDPILIDISMSTTTNGMSIRLNKQGKPLPGQWLKDSQGNATDDPATLFNEPRGSILPLGGLDLGHKGFALGIIIEALTSALGGFGRTDETAEWGSSVFLQIIDPDAFGGKEAFLREMSGFAEACHASPVKDGDPPVRLPGEAGLRRRAEQLENGIALYPGILESLNKWAQKLEVTLPESIKTR